MKEPLDELFFKWLYSQVGNVRLRNPTRTYWKLFRQLYSKEFVWLIPNDDNRLEDGRELRQVFAREQRIDIHDPLWLSMGCSMLEMLIGLSIRLNFEEDRWAIDEWFWHLLRNLNITYCNDASDYIPQIVEELLDDLNWRTYDPDGQGGLFPLQYPEHDQREVEIWYQLNTYLLELN